ncbi:MAG: peptidase M20, partial [Verrucomicrobia bacterium]
MHDPIEKLKAFIRCRSVSTDPAYASGMEDARAFLRDLLGGMGLAVETVSTGGEPVILARREGDPSWPHVIIYGHYDVQPADPFELW